MRKIVPLNFGWEFHPNFRDEYLEKWYKVKQPELVDFPHSNKTTPFNGFSSDYYQGIFSYRKIINIPKKWQGKVLKMRFGGVAVHIEVYCNGEFCGSHNGAYLPFEADITAVVNYGEDNLFVFKVSSYEDESVPPFGGQADYLTYGGVYREVELAVLNPEHITDIFFTTADVESNMKTWEADIEVSSENLENRLRLSLWDADENETAVLAEEPLRALTMSFKGGLNNISLWSTENPVLYTLKAELIRENEILDEYSIKVGFRKAEFTPEGFVLNDRKIKLIGLNRHQSYPHIGYAMPKAAQSDDADYLKSIGVNVVRSSHYPPSTNFLDRCDEIGLMVIEEIPGWQFVSKDPVWRDRCIVNVQDMIVRDRNHPSVIMWGVRINESGDDDELYKYTNELARRYDPTRPTCGVRNFAGSNLLEDIYTFNDFTNSGNRKKILRRRQVVKKDVPYLITEFNGHMYPAKSYDNEERLYTHALRHAEVLNAVMAHDDIMGAIGWCMSDYNTHTGFGSGDGVCYHGVSDMYRMSKPAAYVYQSQNSSQPVLEVSSNMNIGDYAGGYIDGVYVFTNCDYVKLYAGGLLVGKFFPDRKKFPHLKHPPVKIDDFIGHRIMASEGFSAANAKRANTVIRAALKYGYMNLPLKYKLMAWIIMLTEKISFDRCVEILKRYSGGLGGGGQEYIFEGYRNEQLVVSTARGESGKIFLNAASNKIKLVETDTYDTAKIEIRYINEHGAQVNYINEAVRIETAGPVKIIGPDILSVKGGAAAVWVRSGDEAGKATVMLVSPYNEQEIEFDVIKALPEN